MKLCDFMDCAFPKITEFPEMIRIIDYKNSIIEDFMVDMRENIVIIKVI